MIENEELRLGRRRRRPAPLLPFAAAPAAASGLRSASGPGRHRRHELARRGGPRPPAQERRAPTRLFDEEDDFFDLAAELEQELSQEDVFHGDRPARPQPAEQSLEEIVEGFKKGVAEHLSPDGLRHPLQPRHRLPRDGAPGRGDRRVPGRREGPRHLVLCCSMLGLCFLDKGLPELAVKWYRRGLEAPGLGEEDTLGLLYDLGCAYLAAEDKAPGLQDLRRPLRHQHRLPRRGGHGSKSWATGNLPGSPRREPDTVTRHERRTITSTHHPRDPRHPRGLRPSRAQARRGPPRRRVRDAGRALQPLPAGVRRRLPAADLPDPRPRHRHGLPADAGRSPGRSPSPASTRPG